MTVIKLLSALFAAFVFLYPVSAHAHNVKWDAQWIWAEQKTSVPNSWAALRTEVNIPNAGLKAKAYISADTKYWLWINGEMVVFEGSYTGGPTPVKPAPRVDYYPIASNKYYDEIDIGQYLKAGENTIAALAWYYGDHGDKGSHVSTGNAGFIFQAKTFFRIIP